MQDLRKTQPPPPVRQIVIVGGGTAGWMTAAALSKVLSREFSICLVESDEIGTIGVGEATIPAIKSFNDLLDLDENEFLRKCQGTFKLGIEFVNWGALGDTYIHGFGSIGQPVDGLAFYHFWQRRFQEGTAADLALYSINTVAPSAAKFMRARVDMANSPLGEIANAFHFDASLYAKYLRGLSEQRGVQRIEGRIVKVSQRPGDGFIDAVELASGQRVAGEFFIDCSGTRALLIEQTLKAGYEDWTHWLLCDRAVAVPCASAGPLLPITRSTAHAAGWQWRIPLQHRTGNGHVFSSTFMSEDEATAILMNRLDGEPWAEPRTIKFQTGRRRQFWKRNCVAVGLSSGFLEPLESTSIHLIQTAIMRILSFFPHAGFDPVGIDEYNRVTALEYEQIRDFLILHYKATERTDSPFWNHCRTMDIPEALQRKLDLYRSSGRIFRDNNELFGEISWLQVMHGQRVRAQAYHPLASVRPAAEVDEMLDDVKRVIGKCVDIMPTQATFIAEHCAAMKELRP